MADSEVVTNVAASRAGMAGLPLAPLNPLPYRQQIAAIRSYHTGFEVLRDSGGPVTRLRFGPKGLFPDFVVVSSPQAAHDLLGAPMDCTDRAITHDELRRLLGESLFTLTNKPWLPRRRILQPVFTKKSVNAFGGHMAQAADMVAAGWTDGQVVDLDAASRRVTLRALGRSVLGIDLDERADSIAGPMRTAMNYVTGRLVSPVHAPRWLPTPARRRARAAARQVHDLAAEILRSCRDDPSHDAPLVRSMMAATDPDTGRTLSDAEMCNDLVVFMFAGHDTTATTLTYALWALGHHPDIQEKVRAEARAIGDREISPTDLPALGYTVQVLHESLRLCPPAPGNSRMVTQDIEVGGYLVKAGTLASVAMYAMQRDPALWERPLEFDPDRFGPEQSEGRDRWQFIPFSAGARTCIGDHFAMLEATLALATMVRHTEFHSLDKDFPVALPFTMVADGPIPARVRSLK
ncbi:cytochrome P450 [Mycobacterium sp. CBMA293]|uniref:cytochrome P450 n=1 Tax=unclassified Mycolicibacterium TaxID=2636767 RepID=UPI0012DE4529|nr:MULTISPECIES: cytochrome P450 [unclassified Mycolicibacterium]MUL47679.1 cytochrome P450 [Mycolicibacterium sp. CBMA 360]MUL61803.1 cytochrome P450 [Mycolicibacterium sp. CBMA 335]MUL70867.1 cytochrome P450 [Mycolicibacterium sp. CBMA 311]MUL92907.1 cytochrome P450 [Mycolicibacterium sp. CBMA 230]MUM08652.1 cytochrome P450 [Mycolicibacterium sp. CBMA 213]